MDKCRNSIHTVLFFYYHYHYFFIGYKVKIANIRYMTTSAGKGQPTSVHPFPYQLNRYVPSTSPIS